MNVDNFLVRPHRRWVELYRDEAPWIDLDLEHAIELADRVADLPSTEHDDDEEAKRFDLIILKLQLCRLLGEPGEERLRRQVQEIASGLLEQLAIPVIGEQAELLDELAGDEWWIDVTLPMLEHARRRIRGLVRLLEKRKRVIVYTDFVDELGRRLRSGHASVSVGTDYERFRQKARAYLSAHEDHVALQKLRRNVANHAERIWMNSTGMLRRLASVTPATSSARAPSRAVSARSSASSSASTAEPRPRRYRASSTVTR